MNVTTNYVDFTNLDATWRIYTHCADGVGPGYVAKVVMNGSGRVLLDDTDGARHDLNADGFDRIVIGLGKFVFDDARAQKGAALSWTDNDLNRTGNVYVISGRHCAGVTFGGPEEGWITNPVATDPAVNNSASGPLNGTPIISGDVGLLDENVIFQDPYAPQLMQVVYRWKIYAHYLKMWAVVVDLCNGAPGASPPTCGSVPAWMKGPEFTVGLSGTPPASGNPDGTGFTQITAWDGTSHAVCASDDYSPQHSAGPCGDDVGVQRARVQFNYATPTSPVTVGANPNCTDSPLKRCFNSIFRSYQPDAAWGSITPGANATPWAVAAGGIGGFDSWARTAASFTKEGTSSAQCPQQTNTDAVASRKWELPGEKDDTNAPIGTLDYRDQYAFPSGQFWAWRNCVNPSDNQNLFAAHTWTQWGTYVSFSFNTASTNYFAETLGG